MGQHEIVNYQSFAIDNKEVVWLQVYHADDSIRKVSRQLFEHLKRKAWITGIHYEGEEIVADLIRYHPDYKRYGGTFTNTSTVIRTGIWTGKMRIGFKPGKYRVVLYGLQYTALQPATGSGRVSIGPHEVSGTLGEFALNNLRTSFRKKRMLNLDILHLSFKDSFTLKIDQVIDSDW